MENIVFVKQCSGLRQKTQYMYELLVDSMQALRELYPNGILPKFLV